MTDQSDVDDTLGGESSCYAHLLCLDCGVVLDGGPHLPTCAQRVSDIASNATRVRDAQACPERS